jgi:AcrR family transcriptional regulator
MSSMPDRAAPPTVPYGDRTLARLPAPERRRQLLDSALEVFATRGFHGASMNDVADAAGVTKPVLYQHFASKRQLFVELLEDVGSRLGQLIAEATSGATSARDRVERGFTAYFAWIDANRSAFSLLFRGSARLDAEFADAVRTVEGFLAEAIASLIEADIDDEHRRTLAHGIVGLAEGTGRHWIDDSLDLDPTILGRQVADLAYAGLRGVHRL